MGQDTVEIHFFAAARAAVGASTLVAESGALSTILDGISADHPAFESVRPRCSYLLDGVTVHGDVDAPSGSRVDVLPPFAGG